MELKSRKPAPATGPGNVVGTSINTGAAPLALAPARGEVGTGGAEAAIHILNAEDDDDEEDAPVPNEFEYESDEEGRDD